jgi:GDP-L-fucose synthase
MIIGEKASVDFSKPDGSPRKLMDSRKLKSFGWQANIDLFSGLKSINYTFLQNCIDNK